MAGIAECQETSAYTLQIADEAKTDPPQPRCRVLSPMTPVRMRKLVEISLRGRAYPLPQASDTLSCLAKSLGEELRQGELPAARRASLGVDRCIH